MAFLVNLKTWQLFMLFAVCVIFSYNLSVAFTGWILYSAWVYHIGVTMHNMLPADNKPAIKYFQFNCLFVPFMIALIIVLSLGALLLKIDMPQPNIVVRYIILGLVGAYGVWCWIYISLYAGRVLESVIRGQPVNRSDSMKAFICFFVFPLGVWYIQPAVKKLS
jgi:hypothetical protein